MINLEPSLATTGIDHDVPMADLHAKLPHQRMILRTPSPTPSEQFALSATRLERLKSLFRRENITTSTALPEWIVGISVFATLIVLLVVFKDDITDALQPAARWMRNAPGGWLIPIAILIVMSFPPLLGHEIVLILVGFAWGLGPGFGIASAGTYLGEAATFYTFKYIIKGRGEKLEQTSISYAALAQVVRNGGLKIATITRYSVVPGHVITATFSACGMDFITFSISAILSLPKQFAVVYVGVALEQSGNHNQSTTSKIIEYTSLGVTVVGTLVAMHYIHVQRAKAIPGIVYARRKRRQAQLQAEGNVSVTPAALEDGEETSSVDMTSAECSRLVLHAPKPSHAWAHGQNQATEVVLP